MQSSQGGPGHGEDPRTEQVPAVKGCPVHGGQAHLQPEGYQCPPQSPSKCVQMLPVSVCIRKMLLKQARKDGMGGLWPCRR